MGKIQARVSVEGTDNDVLGMLMGFAYQIANEAEDIIRRETNTRTGQLAGNMRVEVVDAYTVKIINPAEYADYLEYGTTAHMVKKKKKKALHWVDAHSGEDRFDSSEKGHMVSGIKPIAYMQRAINNVLHNS